MRKEEISQDTKDKIDALAAISAKSAIEYVEKILRPDPEAGDREARQIERPGAIDLEAAARKLAECMDYPWEHMPEQGRNSMREHAKAVIDAALTRSAEQINKDAR